MPESANTQTDLLAELEKRLGHTPFVSGGEVKRYAYPGVAVLVGLALTLVAKYVGTGTNGLVLALVGLAVEGSGLAVLFKRQSQDLLAELRYSRMDFARQLDEVANQRREITRWLLSISTHDRRFHADFLRRSVARFEWRHALVFGPIEKLGIAPLLAACFVQALSIFSTSRWSFWVWLAAGFIVASYAASLWLFRFKYQLLQYLDIIEMAESVD